MVVRSRGALLGVVIVGGAEEGFGFDELVVQVSDLLTHVRHLSLNSHNDRRIHILALEKCS